MLVLNAAGAPMGTVQHPLFFVSPIGAFMQLTCMSGQVVCAAEDIFVILPLCGPTVQQANWSRQAGSVANSVAHCFPTMHSVNGPKLQHNAAAIDEQEDMDDENIRAEGGTAQAAEPVIPPSAVTFTLMNEASTLPPGIQTMLLKLYRDFGRPMFYAVAVVPCSSGPTPLPISCALVHSMPSSTSLWVPTSQGTPGAPLVRWDTTILSVGTGRHADWSGGGKTPGEMLEDIRHRHASGTFNVTQPPIHTWKGLRLDRNKMPQEVVDVFSASNPATDLLPPSVARTGGTPGTATLPAALFGPQTGSPCCPLDTLRLRKVMMGPDMDLLLTLDDGHHAPEEV